MGLASILGGTRISVRDANGTLRTHDMLYAEVVLLSLIDAEAEAQAKANIEASLLSQGAPRRVEVRLLNRVLQHVTILVGDPLIPLPGWWS